ncbi:MAG: NAD-binding protein [Acidobacteria bacterium]|nr:NAD-binding protein [Acidobacteriota bacterium]
MKAIVVGAGGATRELLRRLGEAWTVTVIDTSEQQLEEIEGINPISTVVGDGTSRLTLQRSGLAEADAVVAASNDDEVNLEVCRLAQKAGVLRVVAIASSPERVSSYRRIGVTAFSPDSLVSRHVELSLEHRRYTSMAFADGRAEAIEFRLGHDSPIIGKALKEINAEHFIIGAVLRGDELIIPHGDTVLRPGDRVTVVGLGVHFPEIVHTFTSGEARFPLNFGKQVGVVLEEEEDLTGPVAEAAHFVRNSAADSLLLIHRDPASLNDGDRASRLNDLLERSSKVTEGVEVRRLAVVESPYRILADICRQENVGMLVHPPPRPGPLVGKLRAQKLVLLSRRAGVPVLIARGSYPYRNILVPARQTLSAKAAERAAIDMARFMHSDLTGMAIVDPTFVAGEDSYEEARRAIGWLKQEAAMQQVSVQGKIQRGNPVRSFLEAGAAADFVILGAGKGVARPFEYAITTHIVYWSPKSLLLVPISE